VRGHWSIPLLAIAAGLVATVALGHFISAIGLLLT
jgi:hypothetical protein